MLYRHAVHEITWRILLRFINARFHIVRMFGVLFTINYSLVVVPIAVAVYSWPDFRLFCALMSFCMGIAASLLFHEICHAGGALRWSPCEGDRTSADRRLYAVQASARGRLGGAFHHQVWVCHGYPNRTLDVCADMVCKWNGTNENKVSSFIASLRELHCCQRRSGGLY